MKSMQPKENNLLIEAGLTAGLLAISAFMLKAEFFWQYQILLLVGAAAGAAFAWYNRKWGFEQIKYLADAAILACVGWIIFRVFKSTFLYKEVIAILAQGLIVFEIIFVFNFLAPGKLGFIRILSLLVFLTSPVFPAQYNIPLAVIYLLIWIFVLRFQLPGYSHQPPLAGSAQRYYSLATSFVCFIIALVLAWSIASNIYLGRIKKGMLLLDEDLQNSGEGGKDTNQADKFYSLQENLQKKVTDMALKLDSYEKRRQMIYLFSELVKDTLKTIEMEKAEIGLVDILKRSGAGLEGVEETLSLTRSYCNMKTALQVQKNKENITDDLKKHPMSMVDKIKVTSLANKIQRTNSQAQLEQYSEAVQNVVDQAKLSKFSQRELNTMNRELVNQKTYELYRQKMQNLERQAAQLDKDAAAKAQEIIEDIQHAQGLDDLKQAVEKIRQLKNDPAVAENKAVAEVVKKIWRLPRGPSWTCIFKRWPSRSGKMPPASRDWERSLRISRKEWMGSPGPRPIPTLLQSSTG